MYKLHGCQNPEQLPQLLEVGLPSGSPQSQECPIPVISNLSLLLQAQLKGVCSAHEFLLSHHACPTESTQWLLLSVVCLFDFIQHTHIACALRPCLAETTKKGSQMNTALPGDVQVCFLS